MRKHIEVIERMMFALANYTVDGVRVHPTLRAAKEALEKQMPEKPVANGVIHHCPDCNNVVVDMFKHPFCDECGKALDWSGIGEGGGEQ